MPPPGRPTLPSNIWMIAAVRMYCTPTVWRVQPTEYTHAVVQCPAAVRGHGLADAPEEVFRSSAGLGDHCRV
jgi:hypothetical protein